MSTTEADEVPDIHGNSVGPDEPLGFDSVAGLIRYWAARQPDEPMLFAGDRMATWGEIYRRARRLGHALRDVGVGPGDRVAFLDRNGIEFFEVLYGCALSGAVIVAVNWRLSPEEMASVVADSTATVLVSGPDYADAMERVAGRMPTVSHRVTVGGLDAWVAAHAPDPDPPDPGYEPAGSDVVMQLYTSGTTGVPKGVMLTDHNLMCLTTNAFKAFDVSHATVSMVAMPLFHIGGSGWAIVGMSRGGRSVIIRDLDAPTVLTAIAEQRVTDTFVVPAVLLFLVQSTELATADVSSLHMVYYGASPISEDVLVRSMAGLRCDFTQLYGLTETCGAITGLPPEDHDPEGPRAHLLRSAGKPFEHVSLRITEPGTDRELGPGEVGEVWTQSDQNMLGYWRKPDQTAEVLTGDRWLHTGDAGWVDAEGYLFLHDRIKDMIVTGAENVYPAEVENVIFAHPAVADAAVIGVPDDRWGETVKALVVRVGGSGGAGGTAAEPSDAELEADIIAFTRERLAHYKCPTSVDVVETLPRNASGKVLKRELRGPYWQGHDRHIQ